MRFEGNLFKVWSNQDTVRARENEDNWNGSAKPDAEYASFEFKHIEKCEWDAQNPVTNKGKNWSNALSSDPCYQTRYNLWNGFDK